MAEVGITLCCFDLRVPWGAKQNVLFNRTMVPVGDLTTRSKRYEIPIDLSFVGIFVGTFQTELRIT